MTTRRMILLCLWAAWEAGWAQPAAAPPHSIINDAGEPLRARFNQDANKTRLLLLVSPT